jgi:hypothetical protein
MARMKNLIGGGGGGPKPEDTSRFRCSIPGCRNLGTMNHSTTGGGDWVCRFHFREPNRIAPALDLPMDWRDRMMIERGHRMDTGTGVRKENLQALKEMAHALRPGYLKPQEAKQNNPPAIRCRVCGRNVHESESVNGLCDDCYGWI